MTNEELVRKAVITTADLAAGGKLPPEHAEKFVDYVIEETELSGLARIVRPRAETWEIHKIGVGRRVALPAAEATAPTIRRGITTGKVSLTPKEIIVPFAVGDTVKEINIEGEDILDVIVRMMARATANNLEELYILGDTLGRAVIEEEILEGGSTTQYVKDTYLAMGNGWFRQADSGHVYDAANANIGASVWSGAIKMMPTKFRRNRRNLRFFVSPDLEQTWREKVSARATAAGDTGLSTDGTVTPFGIPLIPVPLLPWEPEIVEHVTFSGVTPVALRYKPIVSGSESVLLATLGSTPATKYVKDTDYVIDYVNGTIGAKAGGSIPDPSLVKVTYEAQPQGLLTHVDNLILAIGRDIRIEKDRDIYARVDEFCVTVKVDMSLENTDAVVKMVNIGTGV